MSLGIYFKDRGFQYGIAGSLAWHLFWMLAISVTFVSPSIDKKMTRINFVGPVLSDEAFNTLVSLKPEMSETFYRSVETLAPDTLEPEIGNLGHQSPGDAVSVPTGRAARGVLRGTLGQSSGTGIFDEKLTVNIIESPFPISGDLKGRDLFFLPPRPERASGESVFELTVDPAGKVVRVQSIESAGSAAADLAWQAYLEAWQFMPDDRAGARDETGRVRVGRSGAASP